MLRFYELDAFLAHKFPEITFHIEPRILPHRGSLIVFGAQKLGKSLLVRQIAMDLATGTTHLDKFPIPRAVDVALLQMEIPEFIWQENMAKIRSLYSKTYTGDRKIHIASYIKGDLHIDRSEGLLTIWNTLASLKPRPQVVILDPVFMIMAGDESNREHVKTFLNNVNKIKHGLDCAVILITHQRKPSPDRPSMGMNELVGSQLWTAWADTIINVLPVNPKEMKIKLDFQTRMTAPPDILYLQLDQKTLSFHQLDRTTRLDNAIETFLDELRSLGGLAKLDEILAALHKRGLPHNQIIKVYDDLRNNGSIITWLDIDTKERLVREAMDNDVEFEALLRSLAP